MYVFKPSIQKNSFPKFGLKSRFEGKSYKVIQNLLTLCTPISRNFSSGCIYSTASWIQLWLTNFSALYNQHGRTGNIIIYKQSSTAVCHIKYVALTRRSELKNEVFPTSYNSRTNVFWLAGVAEEFLESARIKREKFSTFLHSEVTPRKKVVL